MKKTFFPLLAFCLIFSLGCKTQFRDLNKTSLKEDKIQKEQLSQLDFLLKSSQPLTLTKISINQPNEIIEGTVYQEIVDTIFTINPKVVPGSLAFSFRENGFDHHYISFDDRVSPFPFRIKSKDNKIFELLVSKNIKTNTGTYPVVWLKDRNKQIIEGWVIKAYNPPYGLMYKKVKDQKTVQIKARGNSVH